MVRVAMTESTSVMYYVTSRRTKFRPKGSVGRGACLGAFITSRFLLVQVVKDMQV